MIVAGDFNQSVGDRHHYGGRELRQLLEAECAAADLSVLTGMAHKQVPLACPAIDHIAVAPPSGRSVLERGLAGWEGTWEGSGRLSDHSAVVVDVELQAQRPGAAPSRP